MNSTAAYTFVDAASANGAIQDLERAGFRRDEVALSEQGGRVTLTVRSDDRLAEAEALMKRHGGRDSSAALLSEQRVEEHVFPDEFDVRDPAMTDPESGAT